MRSIIAIAALLIASSSFANTTVNFACKPEKAGFSDSQLETVKKFRRARGAGTATLYKQGEDILADVSMQLTFEEPAATNRPANNGNLTLTGLKVRRLSLPSPTGNYDAAAIVIPANATELGLPSLLTVNAPYLLRPTSRFPYQTGYLKGIYVSRCGLVDGSGELLDNQSISIDLQSLKARGIDAMGYLE